MPSEREIVREAARCFRRLLAPGAHMRMLSSYLATERTWGVFVPRNGFTKPVIRLDDAIIEAFARRDWIEPDGEDRVRLNDAGTKWLKRAGSPDPHRSQHQERRRQRLENDDGDAVTVEVDRCESPLTWLRARRDGSGARILSDEQFEAGERLRRDFEMAQLRPHVTACWDLGVTARRGSRTGACRHEISDVAIAAQQRVHRAFDAVGPELASVLVEVCCFLNGMTGAERSLGLPKRSGKVVLVIALNALARHYGLLK